MIDRASTLRAALQRKQALVVPGCHDALSAKIIESAGFEAVQVSGFGLAGSLLGKPDVGLVDMKDILDITGHIVACRGDSRDGRHRYRRRQRHQRRRHHGAPDRDGRRRRQHRGPGLPQALRPHGRQAGDSRRRDGGQGPGDGRRAPASRRATSSSTPAPMPTPSTACDEAIRRANLYLRSGADMAFIDGIGTRSDIERAVREIHGLLSVNLMDARHRGEDRTHPHSGTGAHWASPASAFRWRRSW